MSAKDYLNNLYIQFNILWARNHNGQLNRQDTFIFLNLRDGLKRTGKDNGKLLKTR